MADLTGRKSKHSSDSPAPSDNDKKASKRAQLATAAAIEVDLALLYMASKVARELKVLRSLNDPESGFRGSACYLVCP